MIKFFWHDLAYLMCGVAGIYAYNYPALDVNPAELKAIRDHMRARGPDGKGEWISKDRRAGLAHRRLAIIDPTDRAAQPMTSADDKLVISFNGEIYNFRELRAELVKRGRQFRSESDTEVLLHLYDEKQENMLNDLRGMFAFIIWDAMRKSFFMARDPYGIKPLYYADDGWTLRAASQVKALLAGEKVSRDPEPAGVVGFHMFGSVPEPFTMYQEIRQVPAGHFMWVNELGAGPPMQYYSIAGTCSEAERIISENTVEDTQQQIRDALLESVRYHLVSDVPVGAFLSAGIDSGSLVGLMRDAGQNEISTITLAFEEFRGTNEDESCLAKQVARQYQTQHTTRWVTHEEFEQDLPYILDAMDQPSIDGINTWFVSKAAKELGLKVVVSGLGGDELFGGYPSFRDIPRWVKWLHLPACIPLLGKFFRTLANPLVKIAGISPKAAGMLEYGGSFEGAWLLRRGVIMPWELHTLLDRDLVRTGLRRLQPMKFIRNVCTPRPKSGFARVAAMESGLYMRNQLLRDSDWAGMAHSLEIRVPLVDSHLVKQITNGQEFAKCDSKLLLANAPIDPLPNTIVKRAKTGFGTPIAGWLDGDVINQMVQKPTKTSVNLHWSRSWLRAVYKEHLTA